MGGERLEKVIDSVTGTKPGCTGRNVVRCAEENLEAKRKTSCRPCGVGSSLGGMGGSEHHVHDRRPDKQRAAGLEHGTPRIDHVSPSGKKPVTGASISDAERVPRYPSFMPSV